MILKYIIITDALENNKTFGTILIIKNFNLEKGDENVHTSKYKIT